MIKRFSLTVRLAFLYVTTSILLLVGLGLLVSQMVETHFDEQDAYDLQDKLQLIQIVVGTSDSVPFLIGRLDDVVHNHRNLYVKLERNSQLIYGSTDSAITKFPLMNEFTPNQMLKWRKEGYTYHGICQNGLLADTAKSKIDICVAIDTEHHQHFIHTVGQSLAVYILIASLLAGVIGIGVAHKGLAPLRTMKQQAQSIRSLKLDAQMPVDSVPVEMADLASSLNAMLARLQSDYRKISEFSSDIAHELRTPITNLLTETQVAISQPRTAEAYREILASNAEEFQRLGRMISDMLFLAKAEHGLVLPSVETIQVADEITALFEFYEALAEERQVHLVQIGDATLSGDRLMLRRAFSNILSNALKYAEAKSDIRVEVFTSGAYVHVQMMNSGATISEASIPRLFDRFYRADTSRTNLSADGVGLGLAITKSIVEMHHGEICVTSAANQTQFTLRFPCQPVVS